jgi:Flp pilus assembly protein protease CpaA
MIAVHDLRRRMVPNWLVLAGAAAALAQLALGFQPLGIGWSEALLGLRRRDSEFSCSSTPLASWEPAT